MLPNYLKPSFDGKVHENQIIVCGNVRFTVITSRLIRIEQDSFVDNPSQFVINRSFEETEFEVVDEDKKLYIETAYLKLEYKKGFKLSGESLSITLKSKPYTRWFYGDVAVHNLGGTVSTLDRVSGSCKLGDGMCTLEGYSLLDDSYTALFDKNGWFETRKEKGVDIYFFGYGHDYLSCVQDYCKLTGPVPMLPSYALGNWWSRYHKYSDKEYLDLMDEFKKKDIPLSVAVIDMDWHIVDGVKDEYWENATEKDRMSIGYSLGWTGYTWDEKLFPNYKSFLKELHNRGLTTTLNLHPSSGVRFWETQYADMANAMGIDPATKNPIPFDCLNPKFVEEYFNILHFPFEKDGVDFWWMDWQQGSDYNWVHQFGKEKNELEIISPLWMLNHIHYQASHKDGKRGLIFSRFSGHGSQRFPIGFSGDTYMNWETLNFQPYFTVTASNLGYGWWSHDIGGHCGGDRDDELTTRWVQFGVFSPIFRLHSCADRFLGREPWNYNKRSELIISDFMRLRHQMFPYLYSMNYRNYKYQTPLMLPMYFTNPENKEAYNVKNQYWFGSEMIVAPITQKADCESGLAFTNVWLPKGKWIDWFTGYVYKGDEEFECFRPLEQIPIFCKAGAIVPMQNHISNDNTLGNGNLEIVIASGNNGTFELFEDDGISDSYLNGNGAFTRYELLWNDNNSIFKINASTGDLSYIPKSRSYKLIFKGFKKDCVFKIDNQSVDFSYDDKSNSYIVKIEDVVSSKGLSISIANKNGLLHDNSDYLIRCYDVLLRSQCSSVVRNNMYYLAEEMMSAIKWKPEPVGDNMISRAMFELAIQNKESTLQ